MISRRKILAFFGIAPIAPALARLPMPQSVPTLQVAWTDCSDFWQWWGPNELLVKDYERILWRDTQAFATRYIEANLPKRG